MQIIWNGQVLDAEKIDDLLTAVHGEKKFPLWKSDTVKYRKELDAFFDGVGFPGPLWGSFVPTYESWVKRGKKLAEFAVAYGHLPGTDPETMFLLSLCVPYAMKLRGAEAPSPSPDAPVIDRLRQMMG